MYFFESEIGKKKLHAQFFWLRATARILRSFLEVPFLWSIRGWNWFLYTKLLERQIWNLVNFKLRILQKNVRESYISYGFKKLITSSFPSSLDYTAFSLSHVTRATFLWYWHPRTAGHLIFDIDNRVEIQKLNQVAAELPPGWVFGVQLGLWQIQALIKIKTDIKGKTKTNNYVVEILSFLAAEMVEKQLKFLISFD